MDTVWDAFNFLHTPTCPCNLLHNYTDTSQLSKWHSGTIYKPGYLSPENCQQNGNEGSSGLTLHLGSTLYYFYTNYFSGNQRILYSPCHYLEGIKMHSLTSYEHSGLVRTVGSCAQTWWPQRCIHHHKA